MLAIAIAGGCASLAPVEPAPQVYSGRFAARVSLGGEREAASGRFTLSVYPGRISLDLGSPLGNTLARIEVEAGRATLTAPRADGTLNTWHGANADALAESVLGFGLPVSGLADWIAGRAAPGRPARLMPQTGPAQRIEQDGWVIVVEERFDKTQTPQRLSFERSAEELTQPAMQLRLVLDPPSTVDGARNTSPQ